MTRNGLFDSKNIAIKVQDTTPPDIIAEFVSSASGAVVTEIDKQRKLNIHVEEK